MNMVRCIVFGTWIATVLGASWAIAEESAKIATTQLTVVVGAAGSEEYAAEFSAWADQWQQVAKQGNLPLVLIGQTTQNANDIDTLQKRLQTISDDRETTHWIILIGHGTHDGRTTKFNLRGPDVSTDQFAKWLTNQPAATVDDHSRAPIVIVNCTSSSGPFINALSGPQRVIVTATQNGTEQNYARFGKFFIDAVPSPDTDLDHDQEVSVLEAFLSASKNTQRFYEAESRIATEHALIDDSGDGRGTRADAFRATRAIAKAKNDAELDGKLARRITLAVGSQPPTANTLPMSPEQQAARDELEKQIEELRDRKAKMETSDYYTQLELIMVKLAKLYQPTTPAN
jgi:protein involved in ribonucleotide reduction